MAPVKKADLSEVMRELGRNGGRARAANQTPAAAERSALARAAAKARWAKVREGEGARVLR